MRSLALSSSAAALGVLLEAGDELADAEVVDEGLEDGVVSDLDLVDLDLGLVGDEVHLSLPFLL